MSLKTVPTQLKYGLVKKSQSNNLKLNALAVRKIGIFKDDLEDDEEDGMNNDIDRVNLQLRKRNNLGMEKLVAAASTDDIYDYDGAYDTFKAAEVTSHPLSRASIDQPKSRYVDSLLTTAKMREREKDRVFEKNVIKERKIEDELYAGQEKFITKAYRDKLEQDKNWEYENSLADKLEQQTDVRKSGMQGFYTNLLTKNISMGGDVDANALSAYTAGSVRQTVVSGQQNTSTTALVIENIGIKPESTKVVPLDKNHIAVDKHAISNTAKLGVIDPAVAKPIIDEPTLPVIVSKPVPVPLPTKKDEEQLMSAKERYLARKRKAEEGI